MSILPETQNIKTFTKMTLAPKRGVGGYPQGLWYTVLPYSCFSPSRATLNCAPANRIRPEMYPQNSRPTEI